MQRIYCSTLQRSATLATHCFKNTDLILSNTEIPLSESANSLCLCLYSFTSAQTSDQPPETLRSVNEN